MKMIPFLPVPSAHATVVVEKVATNRNAVMLEKQAHKVWSPGKKGNLIHGPRMMWSTGSVSCLDMWMGHRMHTGLTRPSHIGEAHLHYIFYSSLHSLY